MMYSIFKDKVERFNQLTAFVLEDDSSYTYAQGGKIVDNIAYQLHRSGVMQGSMVGLVTRFESLHPFFLLACDKLNASLVLMDSLSSKNQLENDILKLKIPHFFCDKDISFSIESGMTQFHPIDAAAMICLEELKAEVPEIVYDPKTPVYVVASSGSSHEKKWIAIPGPGIAYREQLDTAELELTTGHKFLCTRSPAYDARVYEYLCAMMAGGELHLISQNDRRDMEKIVQHCESKKITSLLYIASMLNLVKLESYIPRLKHASLVNLMVTGDTCTPELLRFCIQHGIMLRNLYGSTETTFGMSMICANNFPLLLKDGQEKVPIAPPDGKIIKMVIKDGILMVITPYMGWYIDNPVETEKHFQKITLESGEVTAFNSGDLFEIQNGLLLFKGRAENSPDSKISGEKVNAESVQQCIEAYKVQCSSLAQVCVVNKMIDGRNKLAAYLVTNDGFDCKAMMQYLVKKGLGPSELPVPIGIPALPVMIESNKINHQALRSMIDDPKDFLMAPKNVTAAQSKTELHQKLENIWEAVLHTKPQSYQDNFIYYGGDSICAQRLAAKIRIEINADFTYSDLLSMTEITIDNLHTKLSLQSVLKSQDMAIIQSLTPLTSPLMNIMFMLPPILGEGFFSYKILANSYKNHSDINVYGLTDPSLYDTSKSPKTLDEIVERYVNAILYIKPKGGYKLMGFSYGCFLAYHVALKLHELGHSVSELHLVDGYPATFFQQLPVQQQAKLLEEFSTFIVPVLSNSFYREQIDSSKQLVLEGLSRHGQIDALVEHYAQQCKNNLSLNMLQLVKKHLTFLLDDKTDYKLSIGTTRLYFSRRDQNFLPMIDCIPGIKKTEPSYTYYCWNLHFNHISLREQTGTGDHLGLIRESKDSGEFFVDTHNIAKTIFSSGSMSTLFPEAHISGPYDGKRQLIITELPYWRAVENRKSLITCWNALAVNIIRIGSRVLYKRATMDLLFDHIYAIFCELNIDSIPAEDNEHITGIQATPRQCSSTVDETDVIITFYFGNDIQLRTFYKISSHPDEIVSRFKSSPFVNELLFKHDDETTLFVRCDMPTTNNGFALKDMMQLRSNHFSGIAMSYHNASSVNCPSLEHERLPFPYSRKTWFLVYPCHAYKEQHPDTQIPNPHHMLLHAVANNNEERVKRLLGSK